LRHQPTYNIGRRQEVSHKNEEGRTYIRKSCVVKIQEIAEDV
jgi:hypothetical protein